MRRRDFIRMGSILAAAGSASGAYAGEKTIQADSERPAIDFLHDGLAITAKEYAALLMKMADEGKIKTDYYSNGGVVQEMENKFAAILGKESAVFMPTGTLANHMAIRRLAGNNRRVLVQEQSHFYNDSGDCAETLSAINLITLGDNSPTFTPAEVEKIITKTKTGRVELRIGVIAIESPVRRQNDRMFTYENMKEISQLARNNDIKMHLDGARLMVQCEHTNTSAARYGELYDTVFTSLWKCFNAASGAVLAGSKKFTENLFHERRMFGGSLPAAWPFAAVALYYADSFAPEYKKARERAETFFKALEKDERVTIVRFENGSHIVKLNLARVNLTKFRETLAIKNIDLPVPDATGFLLKINPSFNKDYPENLAMLFMRALRESPI